jgi:arginase family enzyme
MGTPEASVVSVSKVLIVSVPLDLGGNRRGVDMGPSALRFMVTRTSGTRPAARRHPPRAGSRRPH